MARLLLSALIICGASSSMAATYEGRNSKGDACTISVETVGKTAKIGLRDRSGSTGIMMANSRIVSVDGKVVTYSVVKKDRVLLNVAVFSNGLITSAKFPLKSGFCEVRR